MTHPDSSANTPIESLSDLSDRATTRELPAEAPPVVAPLLIAAQVALALIGLFLLSVSTLLGLVFLSLALIVLPFTLSSWSWWVKYPKGRILSRKKVNAGLAAGTWIVRPGSRYAVVIKENPPGPASNPTVADGVTKEELEIMAPVYSFTQIPKGSRAS